MAVINDLIKGESDWHLKINSNFHNISDDVSNSEQAVELVIDSVGYGVINGLTTYAQATPNMTVGVLNGIIHMPDGVRLTPTGSSAIAINTADTTNPRIDIIYLNEDGTIGYLAGTPLPSPTAPSTPIGAFLLSQINVLTNATSIKTSDIVDQRVIGDTLNGLSNKIGVLNASLSENTKNIKLKADLATTPQKTTQDMTYYVNATNGIDTNNGLTAGTAFKTIQNAINVLPQVINHSITINVASGSYNEDVKIAGFNGKGIFNIIGDSAISTTRNVNSFSLNNCNIQLGITGFNLTSTTQNCIDITNSMFVYLGYINIVSNSVTYAGVKATMSMIYISSSTISNRYSALFSTINSLITSSTMNGNNNIIGLLSMYTSVIGKGGSQPIGTTAETIYYGGVIR